MPHKKRAYSNINQVKLGHQVCSTSTNPSAPEETWTVVAFNLNTGNVWAKNNTTAQPVDCHFSQWIYVAEYLLPDHPDSTPRQSKEVVEKILAAIKNDEAKVIGYSGYVKDCCWVFVQWGSKYYCFLNSVEADALCWEVSKTCADNYIE